GRGPGDARAGPDHLRARQAAQRDDRSGPTGRRREGNRRPRAVGCRHRRPPQTGGRCAAPPREYGHAEGTESPCREDRPRQEHRGRIAAEGWPEDRNQGEGEGEGTDPAVVREQRRLRAGGGVVEEVVVGRISNPSSSPWWKGCVTCRRRGR